MQIDGNSIIPYDQIMHTFRHKYLTVILLSLVLAVLSLVSNIYFPQEMEGQWQLYSCIRKIFSKLFNAGIVWAALPFLAGWRSQGLVKAVISGAAIAELTLLLQNSHCYCITVSAILLGCMAPQYLWQIHFGLLLLLYYVHHWGCAVGLQLCQKSHPVYSGSSCRSGQFLSPL